MMRLSIIILFLIFIPSVLAQSETKLNRWSIGANYNPGISYRTVGKGQQDYFLFEHPQFGFNTSIAMSYELNKYLDLEGGVAFSHMAIKRKIYTNSNIPGYYYLNESRFFRNYLSVPIGVNFKVGNRKLKFISGIICSPSLLATSTAVGTKFYPNEQEQEETYNVISNEEPPRFNFFATIKAGIQYSVSEKIDIRIEPNFLYGFLNIRTKKQMFDVRLWNAGLNLGLYYNI